jgi:hypothetical protein
MPFGPPASLDEGVPLRPTRIVALTAAVLVADRQSGRPWFYWIAPLLAFGFAGMMVQLVVGYWIKVGRLETRGRPKA